MSTVLIITHQVKDFVIWKKGFDAGEAARIHAGLHVKGLYQSQDDANDVTILADVKDMEKAEAMLKSPEFKQAMQEAGVSSEPVIKVLTSVL